MSTRFHNKSIIVIGSGTGIGAATARMLAAEGAHVCLADINIDAANAVANSICTEGGKAFSVAIDIADEASVDAAFRDAHKILGKLDGAHINAADLSVVFEDTDILSEPMQVLDRTLHVNLRGHVLCTRAALPLLLQNRGGAIVYTSSSAADAGEPERPAYAMAKSGLHALMRHVASRWGKEGISANAVAPGFVYTQEMETSGLAEDVKQLALKHTRHNRVGTPDDIAAMVAHLLSEQGHWVNGQVYHVNGGALLK